MIDISIDKKDKSTYITDVLISEDKKTTRVVYADNHYEDEPFTEHNFNVRLYQAREDFFEHYSNYRQITDRILEKEMLSKLKIILLSIGTILITSFNNMDLLFRIILASIIGITEGILLHKKNTKIDMIQKHQRIVEATRVFLENMDKFKTTIKTANGEEDWYIFNPTMNIICIEQFEMMERNAPIIIEQGIIPKKIK